MRPRALAFAAGAVVLASIGATATRNAAGAIQCTPGSSLAYARGVGAATRSRRDVWGEKLLSGRGGPTYDGATRLLAPLVYATQRGRRPLTRSRVYYLPLAYPTDVYAPATFALHVADGSQIISRRVDGPSLTIFVGRTGRERYGSCLARTTLATLADGYLPIVETAYKDANGVEYTQESFAGRIDGARSIVSFVHLTVDATTAKAGAVVRFAASDPKRLLVDSRAPVHVARGETADLYAGWLHQPPLLQPVHVNERTYDNARAGVVAYWNRRLADGAQIVVPEDRVMNAERAVLVQQLVQSWRYSVGNPYEELSFAEALDTAQVMAEYGYPTTADGILRIALDRLPRRFSSWRAGELLLAAAVNDDLYRDRKALTRETPDLATTVETIASRQLAAGDAAGRLQPEPLSSDVPGAVDGVPAQVVAWQGLAAISRVWSVTGHAELAARAGSIALRLEHALRPAVRKVEVRMADRSLFLPATLTDPSRPYPRITATRDGSYWNLVMPYAFASGFFTPGGGEAKGILRYLSLHGSRLAGVTRADAHIAYGRNIVGDGLGEVYVMNQSRFLADNDQPDQLDADALRDARGGHDARHVHLGRSGVAAAGRHRLLPDDVHAAEPRREQQLPGDAEAAARARAARARGALRVASTSRSRRRARGSPTARRSTFGACARASGRCPSRWTRSGKTIRIDVSIRRRRSRAPATAAAGGRCGSSASASGRGGWPSTARTSTVTLARARRPAAPRGDAQITFCSRLTAPRREALDRELREIERRLDARARAAPGARRRQGPAGSRGRRTPSRRRALPARARRRSARCGRGSSRSTPTSSSGSRGRRATAAAARRSARAPRASARGRRARALRLRGGSRSRSRSRSSAAARAGNDGASSVKNMWRRSRSTRQVEELARPDAGGEDHALGRDRPARRLDAGHASVRR